MVTLVERSTELTPKSCRNQRSSTSLGRVGPKLLRRHLSPFPQVVVFGLNLVHTGLSITVLGEYGQGQAVHPGPVLGHRPDVGGVQAEIGFDGLGSIDEQLAGLACQKMFGGSCLLRVGQGARGGRAGEVGRLRPPGRPARLGPCPTGSRTRLRYPVGLESRPAETMTGVAFALSYPNRRLLSVAKASQTG